jgi:uncharacterized SAM-binding protein YcdF (DUF218 family)
MFLFSKIIGILLSPLLWVIMIFLAAWIIKNPVRKKKIFALAMIMMLLFTNSWIIHNLTVQYQYKPKPMAAGEQYSAGILLGGLAGYDDIYKQAFFNVSADRFIQTLKLYKQGHIRKIIVTGGNAIFAGEDFREADFLVETLVASGVPKEDILSERDAKNTIENSRFTHRITDSLDMREPYVLITSAFHMPRAVIIFKNEGMAVRPYPCAYLVSPSDKKFGWQSLVPSANAFNLWQMYLREQVGNLFLKFNKNNR